VRQPRENSVSNSTQKHRDAASQQDAVRCAVLTISDTRTPETDKGGQTTRKILESHDHVIVDHAIVPDDAPTIGDQLEQWITRSDIQVIITTGGTGIAPRDTTIEVVKSKIDVSIDGFGELFRSLSWDEVGPAAMLSRAVAGLIARPESQGGETFVFSIPGSVNAVETAVGKLIAPELAHLMWERKR